MYIATAIMALGYTRTNGVIAYNQGDKSFPLLTPARAKKMIDAAELKGLLWEKNEDTGQLEFIPDKEGWNLGNIMVLSGLTYRPWHEDIGETVQNTIFSVVRVIEDESTSYEVVSNTFQRLEGLTETQIRGLASITEVGGIVIDEDDNIQILDGVIVEKKQPAVVEQAETERPEKKPRVSRRATGDSGSKTAGTKRKQSTKKK